MSDDPNPASVLADKWINALGDQPLTIEKPDFRKFDKIEDISLHDFGTYIFALDPWADRSKHWGDGYGPPSYPTEPGNSDTGQGTAPLDSGILQWLDDSSWLFIHSALTVAQSTVSTFDLASAMALIERFIVQCQVKLSMYYGVEDQIRNRRNSMTVEFVEKGLPDLLDNRFEAMDTGQRERFLRDFDLATQDWVYRSVLLDQPWRAVRLFQSSSPYEVVYTSGAREPADSQVAWSGLGYELGTGFQLVPSLKPSDSIFTAPPPSIIQWSDELAHIEAWDRATSCPVPVVNTFEQSERGPTVTFVEKFGRPGSPVKNLLQIADQIIAEGPAPESREAETMFQRLREVVEALGSDLASGAGGTGGVAGGLKSQYGFRSYPEGSINLGLEIVYRQEWNPQALAKGELAKTIPLGPGQSEKVSIRKQQRDKISREMTDVTVSEDTRESTNKTTNSNEVVEEASKTRKWEIKADGSFNVAGLFGGSVSGPSYGGTSASNSRETKKSLAEAMSRASAKLRRERKITVSTEREVSYEETRASEIRNPNDELPVTYYYYTLQQRYLLGTYLASIQPVLFVAEPLPRSIDVSWIRRHGWILNRVLLDNSYAGILAQLSSVDAEAIAREVAMAEQQLTTTIAALSDARESLRKLSDLQGNVASTYDGTLRAYQEAVQAAQKLVREYEGILAQARRLAGHLADNILHYCRAIWSSEDPDRRRMRYEEIRIPTRFIPVAPPQGVPTGSGQWEYEGEFQPADEPEITPLSELIDPTGPIAFAGNYSTFRILKTENTQGLARLIRQTALFYCEDQTFTVTGADDATAEVVNRDLYTGETYTVTIDDSGSYRVVQTYQEHKEADTEDGSLRAVEEGPGVTGQPKLIIHLPNNGVDIKFSALPRSETEVRFAPNELKLRDPELTYLLKANPGMDVERLSEMLKEASEDVYIRGKSRGGYELVHTRTVLIDTDNLYLEIDPVPLLETFKQYHRILDVAMVATDVGRRSRRLAEKIYGDPDVDKVVIVSDREKSSAVAAAEAGSGSSTPGGSPD